MQEPASIRGTVERAAQFVRNGSSCFALTFERHMPMDGHERDKVLLIDAKDCSRDIAACLALLQPKDYVMLDYENHQDGALAYRLWVGLMVTNEPALRVLPPRPE